MNFWIMQDEIGLQETGAERAFAPENRLPEP